MKYAVYRAYCSKCQTDFYSRTFAVGGDHYCTECGNTLTVTKDKRIVTTMEQISLIGAVTVMRAKGETHRHIAASTGVSHVTVIRILKDLSLGRQE